MKKFVINQYLTLKLENNNTNIFINKELFIQCKYLLVNIPVNDLNNFRNIDSIDDLEEMYDEPLEHLMRSKVNIPPETEFWGHCSNIQAWYENNYNSNLLHSNIAFPLLKKLYLVGDPLAKKVFKEEIIK
ncbi:MAG: hypothetical protein JXA99_04670 [Candidatus Lokiarchaeota archaeon]|nr:hypothetical protein [Candidatus Lokiarchaeota archaeon]